MALVLRRIVLLAGLVPLAACVSRTEVLRPLVGQSEDVLVRSLGVPSRAFVAANGHRFLAYNERYTEIIPEGPFFGPFYWGLYGGLPSEVVQFGCQTTFEVVNGRVIGFTFHGDGC